MPDKRPNDAQLRFNARASNSKRRRNSHAKEHRPKNRRLPDSPEIFFNPRSPRTIEHGRYFPGHSHSFARYLSLSYKDPELRINFPLPLSLFPQPRPASRSPTPRNGNVLRAMKMIKRHPESQQSLSNPAPKAKSETPAVL